MADRAIRPMVVKGKVVTFDEAQPVLENGAVYIRPNDPTSRGTIEAIQDAGDKAPAGYEQAPVLSTDGVIYPGLIDLHNHVAYNVISLWSPVNHPGPYDTRYQWTDNKGYDPEVQNPTNALCKAVGKALLKYVETKAIVGGVTAIQGSAKTGLHPYEGWLVRNVEFEKFGGKEKSVFQSALPMRDEAGYASAHKHLVANQAYIFHLCEGRDHDKLVGEYTSVRDHDCLQPTFVAIHTNALGEPEYDEWAPHGGSIVWSPFSNLWLYAKTTDVVAVDKAGIRLCVGADWSPSGSKNVLGELKVADMWNKKQLGGHFSDEEICRMATSNPADALNWSDKLGRLKPELHGDVLITSDREKDPYRNLITAIERDVEFVAINGEPFYGTAHAMKAAGAQNDEDIEVGPHGHGLKRRIVLIYPGIKDADMGWNEAVDDIRLARKDPPEARARSEAKEDGKPLELEPDKPWDQGKKANLADATEGNVDSLTHDTEYFDAIDAATIHGGQLNGLRAYYKRR
jgi:5-methylthioadenosine/S-adenosylhomocysteine deaminase